MLKRAVVFVMLLSVRASQEESDVLEKNPINQFDFTKFDYCSLNANCNHKGDKHSACDCKLTGPRTIISEDLVKFRQDIIDKHNELRNMFASGKETNEHMFGKTASNMMVLNYDLELEYIARCYAGYFVKDRDKCRMSHDKIPVGQNIAGFGDDNEDDYHIKIMEKWYKKVRSIDSPEILFDKFEGKRPKSGASIGPFITFVWANTKLVGCARVWNPENTERVFKWALICNYKTAGNIYKQHIFDEGPPCSNCPSNSTCNDKYTSLCGKLYPAPTDPFTPIPHKSGSERLVPSLIISLPSWLYCIFAEPINKYLIYNRHDMCNFEIFLTIFSSSK